MGKIIKLPKIFLVEITNFHVYLQNLIKTFKNVY